MPVGPVIQRTYSGLRQSAKLCDQNGNIQCTRHPARHCFLYEIFPVHHRRHGKRMRLFFSHSSSFFDPSPPNRPRAGRCPEMGIIEALGPAARGMAANQSSRAHRQMSGDLIEASIADIRAAGKPPRRAPRRQAPRRSGASLAKRRSGKRHRSDVRCAALLDADPGSGRTGGPCRRPLRQAKKKRGAMPEKAAAMLPGGAAPKGDADPTTAKAADPCGVRGRCCRVAGITTVSLSSVIRLSCALGPSGDTRACTPAKSAIP